MKRRPMKNDIETLQAALANLEALDPEAEAASCIEAARRFASMRRVTFDARLAGLMSEAANDGERTALEAIRRAGHRQLARELLEEARGWAPGGKACLATAGLVADIKRRLGRKHAV
ncbi:MAG: hypothetical protein PHI35_08300 [Victivallaceae bacterium]|nr:hypothetical protein [Victivallaceae bacterium]